MPGRATNQEAIRDAIPPGACLTIEELDAAVDIPRKEIVKAAGALVTRGLLLRRERGCFQLSDDGQKSQAENAPLTSGPNGPHTCKIKRKKPNMRARVWRAMVAQEKFTVQSLVAVASKGGEKNPTSNVQRYLRGLERAGYLRTLRREPGTAVTSNGFKRWQLIRHTGPQAPTVTAKGVYDPNTEEHVNYE